MSRRDLALDLTLESEARSTLILIGLGVGVLVLATVVFLLWRKLRETSASEITDEEKSHKTESMPSAESFRSDHPGNGNNGVDSSRKSRLVALFGPASIRKQLSAPRSKSNIQVYRGANGVHTPTMSPAPSSTRAPPAKAHVSPHIVGWMALADSVVGQHPQARPLHARIATQAEIDMISGHVHIPWAHKHDPTRPQPTAVKVQKPVVFHPAVPPPVLMTPPLRESGSINRREGNTINNDITVEKRSPKGKTTRRLRGKENTPPMPSSSISRNRRMI